MTVNLGLEQRFTIRKYEANGKGYAAASWLAGREWAWLKIVLHIGIVMVGNGCNSRHGS